MGTINSIGCQDVEIILSKNEVGYKSVIENLNRDNHLYLSTFNFNLPDEFDELVKSQIEYVNDLKVIFNVYHFDGNKQKKINLLLSRSLKKNPYIQFFYDDNNHSKIVSNGELMYIGSANATLNSQNNFEAGVLISDRSAIKKIEYEVFDLAYLKCTPIITDPISPLIIPYLMISQECDKIFHFIEYLINHSKKSSLITNEDMPHEGQIINQYLSNYLLMFNDAQNILMNYADKKIKESFIIENIFTEITNSIHSLNGFKLGSNIVSQFDFIEDYKNTLEEYKDHYWRLSTFDLETNLLKERMYISRINSILAKLYHLRIKWIELIGIEKQPIFLDSSIPITFWLEEPSVSKTYWNFFVT
jgi:hypothetical protein